MNRDASTPVAIGTLLNRRRERGAEGDPLLSLTQDKGIVPQNEVGRRNIASANKTTYWRVYPDDIVYNTMRMWQGASARSEHFGIVSPAYTVCCAAPGVSSRFVSYALKLPEHVRVFRARSQGLTSDVWTLRFEELARIEFKFVPSYDQQERIAAILSSVDDAIEKTQAVIDQVQVVKRGLMQELLTRGLPGRHTRFKQTEIGEIPEPWEVQPAATVCERIVVGIVIKPSQYYSDSGVPCLRSLNVKEDRISDKEMNYISHGSNERLRKSRLSAGDVVTVRTGYPGTSAVIPERLNGANCVDLIISTPGSRIRGDFLARFVNSERGRAAVEERKGGLAQQHFNVGAMKVMLIPIPSLREQEHICDALNTVDRRIRTDTDVLHSLVSLKSAVMSALLTGELRVAPDPEAT